MKKELRLFLLIGLCTVGIDYLVYQLCLLFASLSFAKGIGFVAGTLFAYFANRNFTFEHQGAHKQSLWRFALLYFLTLNLNILVNSLVFGFLQPHSTAKSTAFLIATGLSAFTNFFGMKYFVFDTKVGERGENGTDSRHSKSTTESTGSLRTEIRKT